MKLHRLHAGVASSGVSLDLGKSIRVRFDAGDRDHKKLAAGMRNHPSEHTP